MIICLNTLCISPVRYGQYQKHSSRYGTFFNQKTIVYFVEALWLSQPTEIMSSFISLPNYKFYWAGLVLSVVNQYCAHSFARN